MANEGSSPLSFSMKESILLDRGKRVDELMSLSLEPDIRVNEFEGEVTVKGTLQLHGEYRPAEREDNFENGDDSLASRALFRSIEEVSLSEDGIAEIRHQFPIDVTIPKERIDRLEDVDVLVTDFDYSFPDSGSLQIVADLAIEGVRSEELMTNEDESQTEQLEGRTFSFEQMRVEKSLDENTDFSEDEIERQQEEEPEADYGDENVESMFPEITNENVEEIEREPNIVFKASKPEEAQANTEAAQEDIDNEKVSSSDSNEPEERMIDEDVETQYDMDIENNQEEQDTNEIVENTERTEEGIQYSGEVVEEVEEEIEKRDDEESENALYLTKMLSNKDEEGYSKLRMCIVQAGESIDQIANRYSLEVNQIKRMNRLKDEQVTEGQILYIPVRQSPATK
ncbi:LysM peptidoglycan-binding domain-containing protein [Salipaludibacillus sp. HK11]|uniref:LysM peptidoglycan-binding domain-containing protein n=1 Tax=Salipaludibacillus sp. HK11 TaxID=3394320 RepID=UPI0039FC79D7